jgi:hypothetical protein
MAQAHMGAVYNKDGFELINNHTFGMPRLGVSESG